MWQSQHSELLLHLLLKLAQEDGLYTQQIIQVTVRETAKAQEERKEMAKQQEADVVNLGIRAPRRGIVKAF